MEFVVCGKKQGLEKESPDMVWLELLILEEESCFNGGILPVNDGHHAVQYHS